MPQCTPRTVLFRTNVGVWTSAPAAVIGGCRARRTVRFRTNFRAPSRLALQPVTLAQGARRGAARPKPFGSERISAVGPPRAIPTRAGPSRNTQVAPRCDRVPHAQNRSGPNECRRSDHGCRAPKKTGRVRTNLGARRTTGGMTLRQVRAPGCRRSKTVRVRTTRQARSRATSRQIANQASSQSAASSRHPCSTSPTVHLG